MIKIDGLDKLAREFEKASEAIASLDGSVGGVRLDPNDPASIERAIMEVERLINEKLDPYAGNALVEQIREPLKQRYREQLVARAAAARAGEADEP